MSRHGRKRPGVWDHLKIEEREPGILAVWWIPEAKGEEAVLVHAPATGSGDDTDRNALARWIRAARASAGAARERIARTIAEGTRTHCWGLAERARHRAARYRALRDGLPAGADPEESRWHRDRKDPYARARDRRVQQVRRMHERDRAGKREGDE